jgi:hypothetical protein
VNQSVTTEGSICSIQSWERTDDIAMSVVTGHENEGLKISNLMEDNIEDETPKRVSLNDLQDKRGSRDLHPTIRRSSDQS